MRERLQAAQQRLTETSQVLTEANQVLRQRQAALATLNDADPPPTARVTSAQRRLGSAEREQRRAATARAQSATAVADAQADYDATREGMHDLRALVDAEPDPALIDRYHRARRAYAAQADAGEVEFGPQAPLSSTQMDRSPLGRTLARLGTSGWMKSASGPDSRTGMFEHRVNLVRVDQEGRRRSATLPYLSREPFGPEVGPDGRSLLNEKPFGQVSADLAGEADRVRSCGEDYAMWRQQQGLLNGLATRQRFRAAKTVRATLTAFLRPEATLPSPAA